MVAKANALRWFGHALRAKVNNPVRMALNIEDRGKGKNGTQKENGREKSRKFAKS